MSRSLLIAVTPGELRAALVEAGRLVDFRLARTVGASEVGAIHLGRVVRLLPALRAALVEIGLARPAFLSADDAVPRRDLAGLHEGAAVLVQVKRDGRADKAAAVTMRLRLPGRFFDWTPGRPGIAAPDLRVSGRERLAALLSSSLRAGEGIRLAPAAEEAPPEALAADLAALRARWAEIEERRQKAAPPHRLAAVAPLHALLADYAEPGLETIAIDDDAVLAEARAWLGRERPELVAHLAPHRDAMALFEAHGIAGAVASLFELRVSLPGGGALIIEPAATATVIDVDSGSLADARQSGEEALLAVDLEAAREIARQIRLRGLAGALVIDFIPLRRTAARAALLEAFHAALAAEAPDVQVLGWTRLGHLELIRPRRRAPLHEIVYESGHRGGLVKTALTVALEALAAAARQAAAMPSRALALEVHPAIAALLDGDAAPARQMLEARLGRSLTILPEPGRAQEAFDIRPV